jgi:tryptophan synthase alpha chain
MFTSPIADTFTRLQAAGHMAFMPFITAGDPDIATTAKLIRELANCGVDLIEVGFPYSDPIADGPVIQASYSRALNKGLHVADIFGTIQSLTTSDKNLPPLVAMVAYSLIFRAGPDKFVQQAKQAGFAGLIVPDLPADEAGEMASIAERHGLDLVQLIAPTTTSVRAEKILSSARGFIYCISVAGTTGVRDQLPPELLDQLRTLKTQTKLPLAVGFGISRPEQVPSLRGLADGVIVGSAIVRHVAAITEQNVPVDTAIANVGRLARDMVAATHQSG